GTIGTYSRPRDRRLCSKQQVFTRDGQMTRKRLLTAFSTQSGLTTAAELPWRMTEGWDVDISTKALVKSGRGGVRPGKGNKVHYQRAFSTRAGIFLSPFQGLEYI